MTDTSEPAQLAALDIFLPSPPPDPQQQEAFLDEAAALALEGHPITVYLQDEDAWAFEERSEEHTSELQSRGHLVCRLLLEKKKENLAERLININETEQQH